MRGFVWQEWLRKQLEELKSAGTTAKPTTFADAVFGSDGKTQTEPCSRCKDKDRRIAELEAEVEELRSKLRTSQQVHVNTRLELKKMALDCVVVCPLYCQVTASRRASRAREEEDEPAPARTPAKTESRVDNDALRQRLRAHLTELSSLKGTKA